MKLNQPLYAIVNPATGEVLGDGECSCISSYEPDKEEVSWAARVCSCEAKVAPVVLVAGHGAALTPQSMETFTRHAPNP